MFRTLPKPSLDSINLNEMQCGAEEQLFMDAKGMPKPAPGQAWSTKAFLIDGSQCQSTGDEAFISTPQAHTPQAQAPQPQTCHSPTPCSPKHRSPTPNRHTPQSPHATAPHTTTRHGPTHPSPVHYIATPNNPTHPSRPPQRPTHHKRTHQSPTLPPLFPFNV